MTLLSAVPVHLGSAHQTGALTLFTVVLWTLHGLRRPAAASGIMSKQGDAEAEAITSCAGCPATPAAASSSLNGAVLKYEMNIIDYRYPELEHSYAQVLNQRSSPAGKFHVTRGDCG